MLRCAVQFNSLRVADVQFLKPKILGMKNMQLRSMLTGDLNAFFQGSLTGRGEL
jgi:hypothetical protein